MIIRVGDVCVKHDLINSIYTTSERSMGYNHTYTIIQCLDGRNLKVCGNCVDDLIKALNQKETIYTCKGE